MFVSFKTASGNILRDNFSVKMHGSLEWMCADWIFRRKTRGGSKLSQTLWFVDWIKILSTTKSLHYLDSNTYILLQTCYIQRHSPRPFFLISCSFQEILNPPLSFTAISMKGSRNSLQIGVFLGTQGMKHFRILSGGTDTFFMVFLGKLLLRDCWQCTKGVNIYTISY